ncbi:hypothetical protein [Olleya marilimosa]|uniref:hypothetical protein n=1 Tax=Olleya marilimosa TaxID=272164 RepID=UPI0030EC8473|tara:strand:- start:93534 stop:94022 length:489 start_codon:yes stop_codon:yes gene_type:complete
MNFQQHINKETATINNFFNTQEEITVSKLHNEGFNCYDAIITSASTTNPSKLYGIVEAKTRGINHDTYDGGVLLQLDKLNSVKQALNNAKNKPENINKTLKAFYLVQYNDYTYLFDLDNVNYGKLQSKKLPKNTASDGSSEWIFKDIFLLQPSDALITTKTR